MRFTRGKNGSNPQSSKPVFECERVLVPPDGDETQRWGSARVYSQVAPAGEKVLHPSDSAIYSRFFPTNTRVHSRECWRLTPLLLGKAETKKPCHACRVSCFRAATLRPKGLRVILGVKEPPKIKNPPKPLAGISYTSSNCLYTPSLKCCQEDSGAKKDRSGASKRPSASWAAM